MANQEDETRNEYLKELAEREKAVAEGIAEIVRDQKGSAKDRNDLVKQGKAIEKSHRTLGGDLTKNVQDMKDGISTTVDGMINETFGPLGGVVSTFTTGFFKRGKENKDNLSATEATLEAAEANLEELKNGRIETKGSMTTLEGEQKKTTRAIRGEAETEREEERESSIVILTASLEDRLKISLQAYVIDMAEKFSTQDLKNGFENFSNYWHNSLFKIQKRLGGVRYKSLLNQLKLALNNHQFNNDLNDYLPLIESLLVDYYDPMYDFQINKKKQRVIFQGDYKEVTRYLREITV